MELTNHHRIMGIGIVHTCHTNWERSQLMVLRSIKCLRSARVAQPQVWIRFQWCLVRFLLCRIVHFASGLRLVYVRLRRYSLSHLYFSGTNLSMCEFFHYGKYFYSKCYVISSILHQNLIRQLTCHFQWTRWIIALDLKKSSPSPFCSRTVDNHRLFFIFIFRKLSISTEVRSEWTRQLQSIQSSSVCIQVNMKCILPSWRSRVKIRELFVFRLWTPSIPSFFSDFFFIFHFSLISYFVLDYVGTFLVVRMDGCVHEVWVRCHFICLSNEY